MLEPESAAPEFTATDQHGKVHRLADYRGRWLVLYFYPKDETPGCTIEAMAFTENLAEFASQGIAILGVSVQSEDSHLRFAEKCSVAFPLLADPDKATCRRYDALGLFGVARRVTYLIGPDGRIRDAYRSEARPRSHVEHAREKLREMRTGT